MTDSSFDAQFVFGLVLERIHQRIVEDRNLMGCVLMHVTGGKDRKFGEELCQFLRRCDRHFKVATADRLKLGALGKQCRVIAWLVGGEIRDTAGPKTSAIATARWSVSEPAIDMRN